MAATPSSEPRRGAPPTSKELGFFGIAIALEVVLVCLGAGALVAWALINVGALPDGPGVLPLAGGLFFGLFSIPALVWVIRWETRLRLRGRR